ncbi:CDC42 small effector protein homolog [Pararge aegeria]|uniref:Jg12004 protein n=2 Tax=Pararge aegeria TaxID=116150 RepID=A0A8S4R897_9NEOP|nr:CDC42 small effector protein homolog [Pararge aegeria]CAH2230700.1 jg12004 [Pararge aegeria aegeria]
MATTGSEMWLQWFACCYQPAAQAQRTARRRIDRSMIGAPTNFQHTGHIGSTDVDMPSSLLHSIQNQMQSKGGYEMPYGVKAY